ncbi:hypothetical protein D1007_03523 [Hordeum vulgare]|nr:hypothetical protein D1007_03523 [Hordeum vulgare]
MYFNDPTSRKPPTMVEKRFPIMVFVENTLRMWAISRWKGPMDLANFFRGYGCHHLPQGSLLMFYVKDIRVNGYLVTGLHAHFTDPFDAFFLLDESPGGYWSSTSLTSQCGHASLLEKKVE